MSCKSQVALIYNFCIDVGHTRQAFILYPVYIFLFFSPERGKKELYGLYIYFYRDIVFWYVRAPIVFPVRSRICTTIAVFPDSSHTNPISRWKKMISFQQVFFFCPFLSFFIAPWDSSVFYPYSSSHVGSTSSCTGIVFPLGKDSSYYLDSRVR